MPDIITGSFQMCGGLFVFLSCVKLHKDKKVRGVSWVQVCFFAVWGYWNIFFYSHLGLTFSLVGGIGVVVMNTIWLSQMLFYISKEKKVADKTRKQG